MHLHLWIYVYIPDFFMFWVKYFYKFICGLKFSVQQFQSLNYFLPYHLISLLKICEYFFFFESFYFKTHKLNYSFLFSLLSIIFNNFDVPICILNHFYFMIIIIITIITYWAFINFDTEFRFYVFHLLINYLSASFIFWKISSNYYKFTFLRILKLICFTILHKHVTFTGIFLSSISNVTSLFLYYKHWKWIFIINIYNIDILSILININVIFIIIIP